MKAMRMTLTLAVFAWAIAGCNPGSGDKEKVYDIKGKIVSLDMDKKSVRLDHEDIPGLMHAMEMPFDVENAKIMEGLKAGDLVQGKLKVKSGKNVISELHKD